MENTQQIEVMEQEEFIAPYTSTRQFNQPVQVAGTRLKFEPRVYQNNTEGYIPVEQAIDGFRKFEDCFDTVNLDSLSDLDLVDICKEGYLFTASTTEGESKWLFIPCNMGEGAKEVSEESYASAKLSLPLKMLLKILKIPFEFGIKNPDKIRTAMMRHWTGQLPEGKNPLPLTIVINNQARSVTTSEGETHNEVYDIIAIHRVQALKTGAGYRGLFMDIEKGLPLFSKSIPVMEKIIRETGVEPKIKRVEYGFTNQNSSQHSVRWVVPVGDLTELETVESSEDNEHNSADDYYVMYTLRSDFSNSVNAYTTILDVGLYRLVCSNGLTAPMGKETYARLKSEYIEKGLKELDELSARGVPEDKIAAKREKLISALEYKFDNMFDKGALSFKIDNESFNSGYIPKEVKDILALVADRNTLYNSIVEPLKESLPKVSNLDFLKAMDSAAKRNGIAPRVVDAIAVEYLSERLPDSLGYVGEPTKVTKPIDIVNMVTFFAQSGKDTFTQSKMENGAVNFATEIQRELLGTAEKDTKLLDKYKNILIH